MTKRGRRDEPKQSQTADAEKSTNRIPVQVRTDERRQMMTSSDAQRQIAIRGTRRDIPLQARVVADYPADETTRVTIYARRNSSAPPLAAPAEVGLLPPQWRRYQSHPELSRVYGADPSEVDKIVEWASTVGLRVVDRSNLKRSVLIEGSVGDVSRAFGVELKVYDDPHYGRYRGRSGYVNVPADLGEIVEGVFGLDNRRIGRSYVKRGRRPFTALAAGPVNVYTAPQVAHLYNMPSGYDGSGQNLVIFAFNGRLGDTGIVAPGGYNRAALEKYFQSLQIPMPDITDVLVQGPGNQPGDGSDPNDSTTEVMLDIQIAGAIVPGAKIFMYFTEFTEQGWVDAIVSAATDESTSASVISISYGNPEDASGRSLWTQAAIMKINEAFQFAARRGITICCASGDDGSNDQVGDGFAHCDFPSSSPWVLAVGGTRLESVGGVPTREAVWNDGFGSATGGGVSRLFRLPLYQTRANVPPSANPGSRIGRGVPDVAAVGDPDTGYVILDANGNATGPIGGTSASAPLWAGLIVRLNQALSARLGFVNPLLYALLGSGVMRDIVEGNNFVYPARSGYDCCTGIGTPDGTKLLQALQHLASLPPAHVLALTASGIVPPGMDTDTRLSRIEAQQVAILSMLTQFASLRS